MRKFGALGVLMAMAVVGLTQPAEASHFRGGILSWEPTTNPGEVEFQLTAAFRRNSSWGPVDTGAIITESQGPTRFNYGDGNFTGTLQFEITSHSVSENWVIGVALDPATGQRGILHTYAGAGPYTAFLARTNQAQGACCRIGQFGFVALNNRSGASYPLQTQVFPLGGNSSPVSGQVPVVVVPPGPAVMFPVAGVDPDGDAIRFRLSTDPEAGGAAHPPGLTVDPNSGIVTWNNVGLDQIDFWTTQIVIEDLDAAGAVLTKTPVDFLLRIDPAAALNNQPNCTILPDTEGLPYVAQVGQLLSFNVIGGDPDPGDMVELNSSGLPAGASMTPALPTSGSPPVNSMFSWTPVLGDVGVYVIEFSVRDQFGAQSLCPVVIEVVDIQPPGLEIAGGLCETTQMVQAGDTLSFDVEADNLGPAGSLEVMGLPPGATMTAPLPLAGGPTLSSTFEWTPTNAEAGEYVVTFAATNSQGDTVTCTVEIMATAIVTFDIAPAFVPPPHFRRFNVIFDGIDWGDNQWNSWDGECGACNSRMLFPNWHESTSFEFLRPSILLGFDASTYGWANNVIVESYDAAGVLLETFGPAPVDPAVCMTYETGFEQPATTIVFHYPGKADLGIDNIRYKPIGPPPPLEPIEREGVLIYYGNGGHNRGNIQWEAFSLALAKMGMQSPHAPDLLPFNLDPYCTIYLVVSTVPYGPYEVSQLRAYLARGGVIVAIAENDTFFPGAAPSAGVMSQLAADLGSTMSVIPGAVSCGNCFTTFDIAPHPLMAGVTRLGYGCVSTIDPGAGGTVLARVNGFAPATTSSAGAVIAGGAALTAADPVLAVESVGGGTLVLSGDLQIFSEFCLWPENLRLVQNLCEAGTPNGV